MTIVYVSRAAISGKAYGAYATKSIVFGLDTIASVFAGIRGTNVHLKFAIAAAEARLAFAFVTVFDVYAYSAVAARIFYAGSNRSFASGTSEAARTRTNVVRAVLAAGSTVQARVPGTVVESYLTIGARKTGRAIAGVTSLSGIEACSSVAAGSVVSTEI